MRCFHFLVPELQYLDCRVSFIGWIVIHTVVQMVRVVGLTDGPGFSVWGDGFFYWVFLDYIRCKNARQILMRDLDLRA